MRLFTQPAINRKDHGDKTGCSADKIGDGFGEKDAVHSKAGDVGQDQSERDYNNSFAQEGEENGEFCFAQSCKYTLPAKLKGHHKETEKIKTQGGNAVFQEGGIAVK